MPSNPFDYSITTDPDAGKDKFSEVHYAKKFLRKVNLRTRAKDWFVWDKKAWRQRESSQYEPAAMALLPEKFKTAKQMNAIMAHAAAVQQLPCDQEFYGAVRFTPDKKQVLINVNNGILKVSETRVQLIPHDEEQLFTAHLEADWQEKEWSPALTPIFDQVLSFALPDHNDRALQQWFAGYLLYPSCLHEVCLISYGDAGTGKSTISDALMNVLGGEPVKTVLSMAQLCAEGQGAYSLPSLRFALCNMGTELDTVDIGDSSNFKRIVSGEPVQVRPIYGAPYPMTCFTKLWFNSNSLPRFKHGTAAELRRVRFLNFQNKPAPEDKDVDLKEKLKAEKEGLLAYMVQGLQSILQGMAAPQGGPESVRVTARFAISNDPVAAFAKECLVFDAKEHLPKDDLWEALTSFLGSWGFPEKTKGHFFQQLYVRFPQVSAYRLKVDGKWHGGVPGHPDGTLKGAGAWLRGLRLKVEGDK